MHPELQLPACHWITVWYLSDRCCGGCGLWVHNSLLLWRKVRTCAARLTGSSTDWTFPLQLLSTDRTDTFSRHVSLARLVWSEITMEQNGTSGKHGEFGAPTTVNLRLDSRVIDDHWIRFPPNVGASNFFKPVCRGAIDCCQVFPSFLTGRFIHSWWNEWRWIHRINVGTVPFTSCPKCDSSGKYLQIYCPLHHVSTVWSADQLLILSGTSHRVIKSSPRFFFTPLTNVNSSFENVVQKKFRPHAIILYCNIPATRGRYFTCLWWSNDVTNIREM